MTLFDIGEAAGHHVAKSELQHAKAAIAASANFFITKPFNLITLKDVITQLMRPPQS
jgi:hypothetical protein